MYLIDTSVWIDYLREKDNLPIQFFKKILKQKLPFGITGIIYQEILQGASKTQDFEKLTAYLSSQRFYHPKDPILTYKKAAQLYFNCRTKGITIRSTIDCLIAQISIEHNLFLLHNDKDYSKINKIEPSLQLVEVGSA